MEDDSVIAAFKKGMFDGESKGKCLPPDDYDRDCRFAYKAGYALRTAEGRRVNQASEDLDWACYD